MLMFDTINFKYNLNCYSNTTNILKGNILFLLLINIYLTKFDLFMSELRVKYKRVGSKKFYNAEFLKKIRDISVVQKKNSS